MPSPTTPQTPDSGSSRDLEKIKPSAKVDSRASGEGSEAVFEDAELGCGGLLPNGLDEKPAGNMICDPSFLISNGSETAYTEQSSASPAWKPSRTVAHLPVPLPASLMCRTYPGPACAL